MIKVLQVVNNMQRAGLETILMNYYRSMDKEEIQFDFLFHREDPSEYDKEIIDMGGKIYRAPRLYPQNYRAYLKFMSNFFVCHNKEYNIIHSHIDTMSFLPLYAAKKADIPIRIAHSHNTSIDLDFKFPIKSYFKTKINTVANRRLACGQEAGKFLFNNQDFQIIPNAVETKKLFFSNEIRNITREKLGLNGYQVLGNIGRLTNQKNQIFLIDVFYKYHRKNPLTKLLIVGDGEDEKKLKRYVLTKKLNDSVIFLGNRSDVSQIYQALDIFLLPSLYEGIPVVAIEAQFSNLDCILSNKISDEVIFNKFKVKQLSLIVDEWVNELESISKIKKSSRETYYLNNNNYDINFSKQKLKLFYENCYEERKLEGKKY